METRAAEAPPFKDATRILSSILSASEKKTLLYLAARMPAWVHSDHLTGLSLAAMFGVGASFWASRYQPWTLGLVVIFLALNWFGDSLDGTLARVRRQERPRYGYYVDHIVDAFGALFMLGGLALSGFMSPMVAMGLLIAYLMMSVEIYLAAHTLGRFQLTYANLGPTEMRILLAIGALVLLVKPVVTILGHKFLLFDVGGIVGIAGMGIILITTTMKHVVTLYREETRR